jgi:hypothetical protein
MTNIAWKALWGLTAGLALALAQLAATPAEATDYDIGSIHITITVCNSSHRDPQRSETSW